MKNILIATIACIVFSGCVNVTNVNPTPGPTSTPLATPGPTSTPGVTLNGFLEGKFTIGPLCPVEPCNISAENKKQAYDARKIQIFMPDGKTLVTEEVADSQTETYRIKLAVGRYLLKVTNAGIGDFTPREVIIEANKTTVLNLDIDTGIR